MKNLLVCFSALAVVIAAEAQSSTSNTNAADRAADRAARRAANMAKMGGIIEKPGSQKGKAVIFNAQKTASAADVASVAKKMSRDLHLNFEVKEGTLDGLNGDWVKLRDREGAAAIVIVGEDTGTPSLLISPDEFWAVVNVAKLGDGLSTKEAKDKFLSGRVKRQIFRAFALIGGSGRPMNESPSTVRNMNDLDHAREALPMDALAQLGYVLESRGMSKKIMGTYRLACQQGWAPPPTNDAQKVIWDKAHQIPTKPIKVEYDPKKGE